MYQEFRPIYQLPIDLLKRFRIIRGQFHTFPHFAGEMGTFDGFGIEIESAGCGGGPDCGIAGRGEGTGLSVTKAGDVVFVSAKVLGFGGSVGWVSRDEERDTNRTLA